MDVKDFVIVGYILCSEDFAKCRTFFKMFVFFVFFRKAPVVAQKAHNQVRIESG